MADMCENCAFRKGCETWHEPRNRLVSQICAAGPLVFLCHTGLDWRDPVMHLRARLGQAMPGARVCAGWKQQVAARQWPSNPGLRWYQRMLAKEALITADRFLAGEASTRELQRDLSPLAEYYHGPSAWRVERMLARMLERAEP